MDNADPLMAANHKVRIYKVYQVYVPSMELGLSQPLYRQRVCPSPLTKGGGHTRQVSGLICLHAFGSCTLYTGHEQTWNRCIILI